MTHFNQQKIVGAVLKAGFIFSVTVSAISVATLFPYAFFSLVSQWGYLLLIGGLLLVAFFAKKKHRRGETE